MTPTQQGDEQVRTGSDLGGKERALLAAVVERDGKCGLVRVARALAERESGTEPVAVRTRRHYTSLYHQQLPSLCEAELVTYCEESGTIQVTSRGYARWADSG
jgi:hypothetical protein